MYSLARPQIVNQAIRQTSLVFWLICIQVYYTFTHLCYVLMVGWLVGDLEWCLGVFVLSNQSGGKK